jgi:uncharacterized membrane protein
MSVPLVLFWTALLAFMPISELRGAIPFALAKGIPWYWAFPFAVLINALVAPACWIFLSTLHRLFYGTTPVPDAERGTGDGAALADYGTAPDARRGTKGFRWYRTLFDRFVGRARNKLKKGVERWGWLAVAAFVAVPLPVTGAWTGTLGAWVLGISKRRAFAAVLLGVLAAGILVTSVAMLGIGALNLFIKKI